MEKYKEIVRGVTEGLRKDVAYNVQDLLKYTLQFGLWRYTARNEKQCMTPQKTLRIYVRFGQAKSQAESRNATLWCEKRLGTQKPSS